MDSPVQNRHVDAEIHQNIMHEVEVNLSAMHLRESTVLGDVEAHLVSAFCNIYNICGEICGIPENFRRFLKSVVHFPEEQHLGLAPLSTDSDEKPFYATFHLGLHCLPKYSFTDIQN